MKTTTTLGVICLLAGSVAMAENRIDTQRANAPELAAYGEHKVGVRTLEMVNPDQLNVLALLGQDSKPDPLPTYDRNLTVEVWYPAGADATGETSFKAYLRDGATEVDLHGQAMRDASPAAGQFPLVLISHGWPGNRFLLSHLGENLASKGYVVASIDHTESTYRTFQPVPGAYFASFSSTLINRPLDVAFVLNNIDSLSSTEGSFLNGLVDSSNTGLIGYSMGGYGAVITAGGGVTQAAVDLSWGAPFGTLAMHQSGSEAHNTLPDPRIKTAIAVGPWGRNHGFWDANTLKGVKLPMLFMAGSQDETSGYETGVRAIWQESTNTDRSLLTFNHSGHNAAAPIPAPAEADVFVEALGFNLTEHYDDAVWDTPRMNNIAQHFATAWLDLYLKGDQDKSAFLDLVPNSDDGVWAMNDDGTAKPEHSHWTGFPKSYAKGMRFERLKAGE